MEPLVSVVIEGYNEVALATSISEVLDGLARQDYPLERVELVLVAAEGVQRRRWRALESKATPFCRLVTVEANGALYYALKNSGASQASGEILAFIDSDVYPEPGWISSIVRAIRSGADVTAGISTFRDKTGHRTPRGILHAAASISFGHVVGAERISKKPTASALVAHNLALRSDVFRAHPFSTALGRNCGIALLYETLTSSGACVRLVPEQRVAHSFSLGWFFYPFRLRVGWEEYTLRRRHRNIPNRWMMLAGPFEPILTMFWYVGLDVPRWFRFSRHLGLRPTRRWALLMLVLALSLAGRGVEMLGMYGAMLFPKRMLAWAEAQ